MQYLLVFVRWTLLSLLGWGDYALLPLPGADALTPSVVALLSVLTPVSYIALGWPVMRTLARLSGAPERTES